MNILKNLQSHHILQSTRGVKGGYRIAQELNSLSLFDFVAIVECSPAAAGENNECGCLEHAQSSANDLSPSENAPIHALKLKLVRFLKEVSITDLITPGRRIDVPFEHVTIQNLSQRRHPHAHYVK